MGWKQCIKKKGRMLCSGKRWNYNMTHDGHTLCLSPDTRLEAIQDRDFFCARNSIAKRLIVAQNCIKLSVRNKKSYCVLIIVFAPADRDCEHPRRPKIDSLIHKSRYNNWVLNGHCLAFKQLDNYTPFAYAAAPVYENNFIHIIISARHFRSQHKKKCDHHKKQLQTI